MGLQHWRAPGDDGSGACEVALPAPFQHYVLKERVGEGAMGVVYEAQDTRLPGSRLAIKFVDHPEWRSRPDLKEAFHEEASLSIGVGSHHLARSHDILNLTAHEGKGWRPAALVMEFLEPSLEELLEEYGKGRRHIPLAWIEIWLRQLADGLNELHQRYELVHRDVKPGNILFRTRGAGGLEGAEAVIGDFGTVCRVKRIPRILLGQDPAGWKDPALYESATGAPRIGRTAQSSDDVYSFGRIIMQAMKPVAETWPAYLDELSADCTHADPVRRPSPAGIYRRLVTPRWGDYIQLLRNAGWRPDNHPGFIGRDFIFTAFKEYAAGCKGQGGVFVIQGPPGVGKSALLTEWCRQCAATPGYFFVHHRGHLGRAEALPTSLYTQLRERFAVDDAPPAANQAEEDARHLARLLEQVAQHRLKEGESLLLIVDALDEADDPRAVVGYLPQQPLPQGVFLILSCRPPSPENNYLDDLGGYKPFPLDPLSGDNLKDVAAFFLDRLAERLGASDAATLARGVGGIFELAKHVVESIQGQSMTVAEALALVPEWEKVPSSQRLTEFYRKSWRRIQEQFTPGERQLLTDLATLLVASEVGEWFPAGDGLEILRSHLRRQRGPTAPWLEDYLYNSLLAAVSWLIRRPPEEEAQGVPIVCGHVQLRHKSVQDFLMATDLVPVRRGLAAMHRTIGQHYSDQAAQLPNGWRDVSDYARCNVVRHLLQTGTTEEVTAAARLLSDLDFLQATLGDEPPDSGSVGGGDG